MSNTYENLGKKLLELRRSQGIRQGRLAELAGVSSTSLSQFEKHGKSLRSFDVIETLFEAVGFSVVLEPKKKRSRLSMTGTR